MPLWLLTAKWLPGAGTAANGFRGEVIRKFAITSQTKTLLLELIDVKACPKHCSLPLQLPEEHFASQGTRGGQRLGPIPLLRVRFLYYDQAVASDALVEVASSGAS